jgi:phage tail sheath gpL-like
MIEQLLRGEPYIRGMVGSDDLITAKEYVIKPKQLVADLYRIVDEWGREGWSKNIDDIKSTIAAEINSTNNSRIDAELTDDAAQALRIIAVKFAFLY